MAEEIKQLDKPHYGVSMLRDDQCAVFRIKYSVALDQASRRCVMSAIKLENKDHFRGHFFTISEICRLKIAFRCRLDRAKKI